MSVREPHVVSVGVDDRSAVIIGDDGSHEVIPGSITGRLIMSDGTEIEVALDDPRFTVHTVWARPR